MFIDSLSRACMVTFWMIFTMAVEYNIFSFYNKRSAVFFVLHIWLIANEINAWNFSHLIHSSDGYTILKSEVCVRVRLHRLMGCGALAALCVSVWQMSALPALSEEQASGIWAHLRVTFVMLFYWKIEFLCTLAYEWKIPPKAYWLQRECSMRVALKSWTSLTARTMLSDVLSGLLYGSSCIFGRRFERYVEAFAKSTPRPEDVFLHSLCVNRVSEDDFILQIQ